VTIATLAAYALLWTQRYGLWRYAEPVFAGVPLPLLGTETKDLHWFLAAWALPTALYLVALWLARRQLDASLRAVLLLTPAIAALVLVPTVPPLAHDFLDYLVSGRILSHYHENPHLTVPNAIQGDPYFTLSLWRDMPTPYGPAWTWLAALVTWIGGDNRVVSFLILKLIVVAAHLGTGVCVYLTVKRLDPARALQAYVAYAWCPFVLVHVAVDGHNDAVMLLFLAAALAAGVRERWELAFPALVLSVLTKFVPVVLLPAFLLAARHEPRRLLIGGGLAYLTAVVVALPLWHTPEVIETVRAQSGLILSSPASVALRWMPHEDVIQASRVLLAVGVVVTLLTVRGLPERCFALLFVALATLTLWSRPWYFTWLVAVGAIAGGPFLWSGILGSVGGWVFYVWSGYLTVFNWWDWRGKAGPLAWWWEQIWLAAWPYGMAALIWPVVLAGRLRGLAKLRVARERRAGTG
jgi:hypothetical protein